MKQRIHWRIFIPVLLIIFILSSATWIIFSVTADQYAGYVSARDLAKFMQMVEMEAANIYDSSVPLTEQSREEQRQDSKDLLVSVRDNVKYKDQNVQLFVFNSKFVRVYPQDDPQEWGNQNLVKQCMQLLEAGELTAANGPQELTIGAEKGLVQVFEVPATVNVRARYFVGYVAVPDMVLLLSSAGKLLAVIAIAVFVAGGIAVWFVARSIARPLKDMCYQADRIGSGTYEPIREDYSLLELEQLKESFNQMEARLSSAEEQNMNFFQNISHDLRTPLVAITGYAQGIQHGIMADPKKAAEIILSESQRMTNLVESILTISKIDRQDLQLRMISIDLEEFVDEQLEILQAIADQKGIRLTSETTTVYVQVDSGLIIRIFQNVIANCIRHAKSVVSIGVTMEEGWGIITIEDDGPGFQAETLAHAFERHYLGENGEFGIGLSIVMTGMEYMGGKVSIDNRKDPAHGAVYRLYFPVS